MFTAVNTSRRQTKQTKVDALSKTQLLAHFVFHIMASQRYISWVCVCGGVSVVYVFHRDLFLSLENDEDAY